jgi:hypothetical protein
MRQQRLGRHLPPVQLKVSSPVAPIGWVRQGFAHQVGLDHHACPQSVGVADVEARTVAAATAFYDQRHLI